MEPISPTASEVLSRIGALTQPQVRRLAELSGVPMPTLLKVKYGTTENPGIATVGKFWPFVDRVEAETQRRSDRPA